MATRSFIGDDFIKELMEKDIVPENCVRFIMDIGVDRKVKIYYEVLGDEKLLSVDWGKIGPEIKEEGGS